MPTYRLTTPGQPDGLLQGPHSARVLRDHGQKVSRYGSGTGPSQV